MRERDASITERVRIVERHAREAALRDQLAARRDEAAATRDHAAAKRGSRISATLRRAVSRAGGASGARLLAGIDALLSEAAWDRACAANDRREAAADRGRAAKERAEAIEALRGSHYDELTGAYRRGLGEEMLRDEITRARRSENGLALVILDVDGLKHLNDTRGHLAGDELLRRVVAAIRANIRSYEPVVRMGGDEFVFTMAGVRGRGAAERCELMRAELAAGALAGDFTAGIAELGATDELEDLLRRADESLVSERRSRRRSRGREAALTR